MTTDDMASAASSLEVLVNGKRIPMNPFVRRIVTSAILGIVTPLKRVVSPRRVEITIDLPIEIDAEGESENRDGEGAETDES